MSLSRTPLFEWHSSHGGRMVEFGGWEMPVQYTSIVDEHQTVRKAIGLFDISHMGRLSFQGPDAGQLLGHLLTCRVDNLVDGQIRYGLVCKDSGGILDDVLVNRIDANTFGLVVNASNRTKIVDWIAARTNDLAASGRQPDVKFEDHTLSTAMIAVQGPLSVAVVNQVIGADVSTLRYYAGRTVAVDGVDIFVSRTGYTGEDGFELIIPNNLAVKFWEAILATGQTTGIKPCGLGCRDTLRLEAAMPLYGHELSEAIDPLTAGLSFAVKLDKLDFVGRTALLAINDQPNKPARVGLKLSSRRIAREHAEVYSGETRIGEVTSGSFSPTLEKSIAMAYVGAAHAATGTKVEVDIRGKREPAEVVTLPFYKRG